jgi:S1-C subfamily serine protease
MNVIKTTASLMLLLFVTTSVSAGDSTPKLSIELPTPGASGAIKSPIASNFDSILPDGLSEKKVFQSLTGVKASPSTRTRGAKEAGIFRNASPSVVLVATNEGFGSGSFLGDNLILTNWHVVEGYKQVGILFKPADNSGDNPETEVMRAEVIRHDEVKDLALLRVASVPENAKPLEISDQDSFEIGSDVHAIGHPSGLSWTYTKGIISQYRPDYTWKYKENIEHNAAVIQTQTPINGGNSGGPLLAEDGKIIGVNSFKGEGEGLSFAVAAPDLRKFLAAKSSVVAKQLSPAPKISDSSEKSKCEPKLIFEGRDKNNDADIRQISLKCDGYADITFVYPDDVKDPFLALFDTYRRKIPDAIVYDFDRNGKWKISYWDVELDDTFAVIGRHPDGQLKPSSFEKRCKTGTAAPKSKCIN